jgi:hypothetical protein
MSFDCYNSLRNIELVAYDLELGGSSGDAKEQSGVCVCCVCVREREREHVRRCCMLACADVC